MSENFSVTLGELAHLVEGTLAGDPATVITGVGEIESAVPGEITYAVNRQYVGKIAQSRASAVVVPQDVESLDTAIPFIRVRNPYFAFARILKRFEPARPSPAKRVDDRAWVADDAVVHPDAEIGPFAVIGRGARVGAGSVVGAGAHVGHGAELGDACFLHPRAVVLDRCKVGHRAILHSGCVIGSDGYGFVTAQGVHHKIPQIGIVVIEDDVEIGAGVTIDRATIGETRIGAGTKIDNLVQIAHNVRIGPGCLIVAQSGISGSTRVGAQCRFAGQSGTTGHVSIGDNTTIAARGVVSHDTPANSFLSGFPARAHREELKSQAAVRQLPELMRRVKQLEKQLARQGQDSEEKDS